MREFLCMGHLLSPLLSFHSISSSLYITKYHSNNPSTPNLFPSHFPIPTIQTKTNMSAAIAAAAAAAAYCSSNSKNSKNNSSYPSRTKNQYYYYNQYSLLNPTPPPPLSRPPVLLGRYESQKRKDWNTFLQYLSHYSRPLSVSQCSGAHVVEFMKYLDQFGTTKVHNQNCPFYGEPNAPVPCSCPLRQAWGSLDGMIGRLGAAFEENGGQPETNPFAVRAVSLYLLEIRYEQAKARGFGF